MTKKAPYTVEKILEIIRNKLSPAQQRELCKELARQLGGPEEPITAWGMLLEGQQIKRRSVQEDLETKEAWLAQAEAELKDAQEEIRSRPRPRRMSKERIETAKTYQRLRERHAKESTALHALVNLPEERKKAYAREYHRTKDNERLRQCVKSVMRDYKKHEARRKTKQ